MNNGFRPKQATNYLWGCLGPRNYFISMHHILGYKSYLFYTIYYYSHAVTCRMGFQLNKPVFYTLLKEAINLMQLIGAVTIGLPHYTFGLQSMWQRLLSGNFRGAVPSDHTEYQLTAPMCHMLVFMLQWSYEASVHLGSIMLTLLGGAECAQW